MKKDKISKKTRFLFGLWCALYALFNVSSSIYVSYQQVFNDVDPTKFLGGFQFITLGIVSLFFLPSLCGIYHLTKQYDSKKLKNVVRVLLLLFCVWTLAMILSIIVSIVMPGFLT